MKGDKKIKWIFIMPALLIVGSLLIYPMISSIFYSFTNRHLIKGNYKIVGLKNYISILKDINFYRAFWNSLKWTFFSLVGQVLVGFVTAMILNKIGKGKSIFKTLLIVPWAFPTIVIALSWKWILNGVYGYLPNILVKLGITQSLPQFLNNPKLVFPTLLFINIWFGAPLIMVNVLSALQTIPQEQYEAAKVDGASAWQTFKYITLPHIRVVVGLLVVLRTIWIFNNFDIIYLITGGGPASITTTLPIYAYNIGWGSKMLGKSSAVTILLLIFLIVESIFYFKVINKWEEEMN